MKVIIAGSRHCYCDRKAEIFRYIDASKFKITTVISGGAKGVDKIGEEWAKKHDIPAIVYRPHYEIENPRYAPLLRNMDMARDADALIAIWDGKSRGTKHMIGCMTKLKKPVEVIILEE